MTLTDACLAEVHEFHEFVEAWLAGRATRDDETYERAHAVLADDFEIVSPSGERRSRATLLDELEAAHGLHADSSPPFEVDVREVRHRYTAGELCLVGYEEWQRVDGDETGRVSSALFRRDETAPNGVEWLHLHETWR